MNNKYPKPQQRQNNFVLPLSKSFDSLDEKKTNPNLSIIIPAYNEENRIRNTLHEYTTFLSQNLQWQSNDENFPEMIIVSDGSTDDTARVVEECMNCTKFVQIKCISLVTNQGKGAAIATACSYINPKSDLILITDADGSADISNLDQLYNVILENCLDLVTGYRISHLSSTNKLRSIILRNGFRFVVRVICGDLGIGDTQCGFKLMTKESALTLYPRLHSSDLKWTFDVELFYLARELALSVGEVELEWKDVSDGSKLIKEGDYFGILSRVIEMFWGVVLIRCQYLTGAWLIEE